MPLIRVPIGADGPVIDLGVWVGRAEAHGLIARGQAVLQPQTVRALIDTGADRTAVHPNALALIGSPPSGTVLVRRSGGAASPRRVDVLDVHLAFGGVPLPPARFAWVEVEAAAVAPANPGVLALIGRDVVGKKGVCETGPGPRTHHPDPSPARQDYQRPNSRLGTGPIRAYPLL
jgi:hypothetical protein